MGAYGTHHKFPRSGSYRPFAHVVQIRCAKVTCHHDNCVPEVNHATLAICEATIIENLEEQRDEFARCLLNLVDENDGVWLAPHIFRQLPTRVMPDIARWGTNKS